MRRKRMKITRMLGKVRDSSILSKDPYVAAAPLEAVVAKTRMSKRENSLQSRLLLGQADPQP